jgi:TIR domain
MKIFVSYAFNDANKWVEELAIPLMKTLGFDVVIGRHLEGEPLVAAVDERMRRCIGCVAFTTRRIQRADGSGSYESHPWVVGELNAARGMQYRKIVEVREKGVELRDANDGFVRLNYIDGEHGRTLVELAELLTTWKSQRVSIQLVPPEHQQREFMSSVARREVKCIYEIQREGEEIAKGEAKMTPKGGSCFLEIDIPFDDVLIQISITKQADNNIAWASSYTGLLAIPVLLH